MVTKTSLSRSRRRLLELMQEINFGRIENVFIFKGEPVFYPFPRVIYEIKFSGENNPRPERKVHDFELKNDVLELFRWIDRIGNGKILVLKIKHGLPFLMDEEMKAEYED